MKKKIIKQKSLRRSAFAKYIYQYTRYIHGGNPRRKPVHTHTQTHTYVYTYLYIIGATARRVRVSLFSECSSCDLADKKTTFTTQNRLRMCSYFRIIVPAHVVVHTQQ